MKKSVSLVAALLLALSALPAEAAFVVGGENGWQLSTDGIVDVFATYDSTSKNPGGNHDFGLLDVEGQRFGIGVGLLPSVVGINIKAPTVNGIESTVRVGIYPSIQNTGNGSLAGPGGLSASDRFSVGPNIDFREINMTATGSGRRLSVCSNADQTIADVGSTYNPRFASSSRPGRMSASSIGTNSP